MGFSVRKTAQGTIEYLLIIAVVVVISLAVVGSVIGIFSSPSQQLAASSSEIGNSIGSSISISEAIIDSNGDSLIKLNNNSGDNLVLNKIIVGGAGETNFDEQIVNGDAKTFSLVDAGLNCPCLENQKKATCNIELYYTSASGLEKKETRSVTVECVTDTQAVNSGQVVGLGAGTLEDPWIINSCLELQDMNQHLDGNYALGGDINCSDTINWNNGLGFKPIGDATHNFIGTFNGRNKSIANLYINRPDPTNTATTATLPSNYIALFGYLYGAEVSNLNLVDVNVTGNNYVSGLTGYANYSSTINKPTLISDVTISGSIIGITRVGGAVGYLKGSVLSGIHNTANILSTLSTGPCYTGGVVGVNGSNAYGGGKIFNSSNSGNVNGSAQVGGIVGYNYAVPDAHNLINLYNDGNVSGREGQVGGIAGGLSYTILVNAYNKGAIFGYGEEIGGITAYNYAYSPIYNSYNTGTVTGYGNYTSIGGITGLSRDNVVNSFSTGSIINSNSNNLNGVVGLQATSSGTATNLYWVDKAGDNAVFCNAGTDVNCVLASSDSDFYSNTYGIYTSSPVWTDGNWVWNGTDFPVFAWQ